MWTEPERRLRSAQEATEASCRRKVQADTTILKCHLCVSVTGTAAQGVHVTHLSPALPCSSAFVNIFLLITLCGRHEYYSYWKMGNWVTEVSSACFAGWEQELCYINWARIPVSGTMRNVPGFKMTSWSQIKYGDTFLKVSQGQFLSMLLFSNVPQQHWTWTMGKSEYWVLYIILILSL